MFVWDSGYFHTNFSLLVNCSDLFTFFRFFLDYGVLHENTVYLKFFLLRSKIHETHELGDTFPNTDGRGGSIECILVLNLPWSIENIFYFEMFFLNSKFHEIRQLGPAFIHREAEERH